MVHQLAMKRKSPMLLRRVPVDFRDAPMCSVPVGKGIAGESSSSSSPKNGNTNGRESLPHNASVLDCGGYDGAFGRKSNGLTPSGKPFNQESRSTASPVSLPRTLSGQVGEGRGEGGLNSNSKLKIQNSKLDLTDATRNTQHAFKIEPRQSQIANRKSQRAFTLVEILVVLVLLSLIIFALMAVFNGTQKAFRASLTQSDTLEGGRAVMDLIAADLAAVTPCNYNSNYFYNGSTFDNSNMPVNFFVSEYLFAQAYPPVSLVQTLITSPSGAQVTNILENIYVLSKNNLNGVPSWVGTGYSVNSSLPDGTLYPLYRFYMTTNASSGVAGVSQMFNNFVNFQYSNSNYWSHLMDGVVRLTAQVYDTNGVWMTNGYINPSNFGANFHVRFVYFTQDNYGLTDSVFYSNAVPASVQIELGTLEDRTLDHAEGLSGVAQSNYLAGAAGNVHIFRQRVWIRNLDPTAYQP